MVFITDGHLNDSGSYAESQQAALEAALEYFNTDGTAIFTVAMGSTPEDAFMENLAGNTKGKKYSSPDVSDLDIVFPQVAYDIGIGNGTISGTVYDDKNRSGTFDAGDIPLQGYDVRIEGINLQTPGVVTTDANGVYTFGALCDDTYTISQPSLPAGWLQILPINNGSYTITIADGNQVFGQNFFNALGYVVEGYVFSDLNKNRVKEAGEPPYNGPITVSTNSTTTVYTTIANGYYKIEGFMPGNYTISYTSPIPADFVLIYPQNGPPPSYLVSVGPASCVGDAISQSVCTNGNISNLNFAISDSYPWFQFYNANVRADNGITDRIPPAPLYPAYLSTNDAQSTTPGLVFSGDGTISTGRGQISTNNRVAGGTVYSEVYSGSILTSYTNLLQTTNRTGVAPIDMTTLSGCANLGNCTLPANLPSGIYHASGDVTLNAYNFPAGGDFVFLIDGNLLIRGNLILPQDSTATYAASGDIVVDQNIGAATNTFPMPAPQLMGFFSAGGNFVLLGINDCIVGTDRMLNIKGTIITNAMGTGGAVQNNRDLCGDNYSIPSFTITASLDGILNAPSFIMKTNINSIEAAP